MGRITRIAIQARWTLGLTILLVLVGCGPDVADPEQEPIGDPAPVGSAPADWCAGHGLPESKCTKCNPELVAGFRTAGDWCDEHGFPESVCPVCNPQAPPGEALPTDWCAGHGLPESKCTKCNPELVAGFRAVGDWCDEHGFPESACPICSPQESPADPQSETVVPGTRIRFRSPEIERASGIETEQARPAELEVGVECTARIEFDRNRLADIRASVPGVVREVRVDLGERVDAGSALFVLESAEVAELQGRLPAARERLEAARANHARQLELREPKIASARQVEQARAELETAEAELRSLESGLRIAGATGNDAGGRFLVRSPIAGTVVRRPATIGTFATSDVSLATIADTSRMWALLEVREADSGWLRIGQSVAVHVETLAGHEFSGQITWIASEVDRKTRTVAARAEVANPDGLLRAEQFARASVEVGESADALAVPRRAVQRVGEESVVFVRTGEGVYEPRVVSLGRSDLRVVEIRGAVRNGDPVVTEGAFLLKTELSRESIGAGCCEVEPPGGS
jgi:cobalt-zinc-cadmium efflux system membrane fusion protein